MYLDSFAEYLKNVKKMSRNTQEAYRREGYVGFFFFY